MSFFSIWQNTLLSGKLLVLPFLFKNLQGTTTLVLSHIFLFSLSVKLLRLSPFHSSHLPKSTHTFSVIFVLNISVYISLPALLSLPITLDLHIFFFSCYQTSRPTFFLRTLSLSLYQFDKDLSISLNSIFSSPFLLFYSARPNSISPPSLILTQFSHTPPTKGLSLSLSFIY